MVASYERNQGSWTISIADNGVGKSKEGSVSAPTGLGTSIINALAEQLGASVHVVSGPGGTTLSIVHAQTAALVPKAA